MANGAKGTKEAIALFWHLHQPMARDWESLRAYILRAPEAEAWLFLKLLSGSYWYPRTTAQTLIRVVAHFSALPEAILHYSVREVGDTAEALTLTLIPPGRPAVGFPEEMGRWLMEELPGLMRSEERLTTKLTHLWQSLAQEEAFFLHKVLLHSAHLPALRPPMAGTRRASHLGSLLRARWSAFSEETLLACLRAHLTPPTTTTQPTLF